MQFGESFPEISDADTLVGKFWSDEPAFASPNIDKRQRTVELGVLANNFTVTYRGPENPGLAQTAQLDITHRPVYQPHNYSTIHVQTGNRPRVAFNMPDPRNAFIGPSIVRQEFSAAQHDISPYLKAVVRKLLA